MSTIPVSVVIITKNEEDRIRECLDSVKGWADEIIVVDDESSDRTPEIVREYTDKIFTRKMDNEGRHRNWAYAKASNVWVLSLDADERLTEELKKEIGEILPKAEFDGYAIPRRNFVGDYWVKHGGQYPSAQLRLFKRDKFKYEEVNVHPRAFMEGQSGLLKGDMIHKSYRNFAHFLAKLNGQTTLEAQKWFETNRKMSFGKALWRTFDRFPRTYFRKKGYKDGFIGFMVAFFASLYQIISYAKFWEMQQGAMKKDEPKP